MRELLSRKHRAEESFQSRRLPYYYERGRVVWIVNYSEYELDLLC